MTENEKEVKKKLCIAMYGRPNSGKSCILSRILFDRLNKKTKGVLAEGVYYYGNIRILFLQYSMEESHRNIEKVIEYCSKKYLEFDILLVAVKMYEKNIHHKTMEYLVKHFDTRVFVLKDQCNNYKLPYDIPKTEYKIEGYIDYICDNDFMMKVDKTANTARKLLQERHI